MAVNSNIMMFINRLNEINKAIGARSPQMREALTRIGLLISSETMLNIRRRGLIDTGNLLNSIRYELFMENDTMGVKVGSFGVPYAAVHEFGFQGSVQVGAYQRFMHTAFGKEVKSPRMVQVAAHQRFLRIPERPYLRPAVRKHQAYVLDTIREALRGTK